MSRNSEELKKTVWLNVVPLEDMYLPPPPPSSTSKVCPACGTNNSGGARFCRKCGTPFTF
ncbi:MAG: zinc ribbon domain-containing protein [Thermoproteota archaeon]